MMNLYWCEYDIFSPSSLNFLYFSRVHDSFLHDILPFWDTLIFMQFESQSDFDPFTQQGGRLSCLQCFLIN